MANEAEVWPLRSLPFAAYLHTRIQSFCSHTASYPPSARTLLNTARKGSGDPRKMGEYRSCRDLNVRKRARSSLKDRSSSSRNSSWPPADRLDTVFVSAICGTAPSAGWSAGWSPPAPGSSCSGGVVGPRPASGAGASDRTLSFIFAPRSNTPSQIGVVMT